MVLSTFMNLHFSSPVSFPSSKRSVPEAAPGAACYHIIRSGFWLDQWSRPNGFDLKLLTPAELQPGTQLRTAVVSQWIHPIKASESLTPSNTDLCPETHPML
jgi:hypothetical protein